MNAIKVLLIIALWIAAALIAIWGTNQATAAPAEWKFDCDEHQVRFGLNSLTIDDQQSFRLLRSGDAFIDKKDGSTLPATVYEFENDRLLIISSVDPTSAALIIDDDAIVCVRY